MKTNLSITREIATEILEEIANVYGNPDLFDGSNVINEDGTTTKCEPDGSWYEFEDLVTEKLDKLVDTIRYRVVNCIDETQKEKK
jgi:hypothetical protein